VDQSLVDWLRAEAPERQVYERPPLVLALCQVRFTTRFGFGEASVAPFQEAIEDRYPNSDRQQQVAAIQVGSASGQIALQPPVSNVLWQFTDESGDWTVTLTNEFVTLETRAYARFEHFLERLTWVLDVLVRTVKPTLVRRIGLRYIDEIRTEDQNWAGIIKQELLGALAIDAFRDNCEQSLQVLTLRLDQAKVTLNHGVFPSGSTVVPKPGTVQPQEPFYLLDIDMYQEFNPPASLKMDPAAVCQYVEGYHDSVGRLFRWATTEVYRASLGVREDVR
jgi:uncharacterized protein (TIGR04255 family)